MLDTIIEKFGNIRMSVEQYLLISLAAAVGVLVTALKLQGSRLHATQVKLLKSQYDNVDEADQAATDQAKAAFEAAYKAYMEAK